MGGREAGGHGRRGATTLVISKSLMCPLSDSELGASCNGYGAFGGRRRPLLGTPWSLFCVRQLRPGNSFACSLLLWSSPRQTVRLFAPWKATNRWHEIARPQVLFFSSPLSREALLLHVANSQQKVHGYDMSCVCFARATPHRLVTGAEEKVYMTSSPSTQSRRYISASWGCAGHSRVRCPVDLRGQSVRDHGGIFRFLLTAT